MNIELSKNLWWVCIVSSKSPSWRHSSHSNKAKTTWYLTKSLPYITRQTFPALYGMYSLITDDFSMIFRIMMKWYKNAAKRLDLSPKSYLAAYLSIVDICQLKANQFSRSEQLSERHLRVPYSNKQFFLKKGFKFQALQDRMTILVYFSYIFR